MKLVILSDTHGSTQAVERVFSEQPDAELYLHAGDVLRDAEYLATLVGAELNAGEQDESVSPRVIGVPGNTDWPDGNQPLARIVCAAGHRILLAHGHSFGVQYTTKFFADAAAESNCDIAVYGHTHIVDVSPAPPLTVLKPGSAARPRDAYEPSYMVVEMEEGQAAEVRVVRMKEI